MHRSLSILINIKNIVKNVITFFYMEMKEERWISNRHWTLKKIDLHHEELPERFKDHLFAIVTNQNYDENKLLKTDYTTFLYT